MNVTFALQQPCQLTQTSSASIARDSTSAWTRWLGFSLLAREWIRRLGRDFSTICPVVWDRWWPWTTLSLPQLNRRIWLSLFTCSFLQLCPWTAPQWVPNSVHQKRSHPKSLEDSSWCQPPTDSLLFLSPTQLSLLLQPRSFPCTQTQVFQWLSTPVTSRPARVLRWHLLCREWPPSRAFHRPSVPLVLVPEQKAMNRCGDLGRLAHPIRTFKTVFHDEENTFSSVLRDFVDLLLDKAYMFVSWFQYLDVVNEYAVVNSTA